MKRQRACPPEYLEGLRLYRAGAFWDSHEAWEAIWRKSDGAAKHFFQGLIQLDAALIHTRKGHWGGVMNLLRRALGHLEQCPRRMLGMNVASVRKQVRACLREVRTVSEGRKKEFDWSLMPKLEVQGVTHEK